MDHPFIIIIIYYNLVACPFINTREVYRLGTLGTI